MAMLGHDRFRALSRELRGALEADGGGGELLAALSGAMDEGKVRAFAVTTQCV
jgi:hypothetical protein